MMDSGLLRLFQMHVQEQCEQVLLAAPEIYLGSHEQRPASDGRGWLAVQLLVVATANLSKLLWGEGGRHAEKREPLRLSLGVDDSSPLRETLMRNHFEHFDERLDLWAEQGSGSYFDKLWGPVEAFAIDAGEIDIFRMYDPATGTLRFWGDTFVIRPIVAEVERILPVVHAAISPPR
jgi:hypothetical protein